MQLNEKLQRSVYSGLSIYRTQSGLSSSLSSTACLMIPSYTSCCCCCCCR